MKIKVQHPELRANQSTFLVAKASSSATVLNVSNAKGKYVGKYVIVGIVGTERAEIRLVTSVDVVNKTITVDALVMSHSTNDPVTVIDYNQVKMYKSPTKDGSYDYVEVKDIAVDEDHTLFEFPNPLSTTYFRTEFFNSNDSTSSGQSGAISAKGHSRYALNTIIDDVLKIFGDRKRQFLSRGDVIDWINEAKDDMANEIAESGEVHFGGSATLTLEDGSAELPKDFKKFREVKIDSKDAQFEELDMLDQEGTSHSKNKPCYSFNGYRIEVRPKTMEKVALSYEGHPADLFEDDDELPAPIKYYKRYVIDYVLSRAYEKDKKYTMSDRKVKSFENGKLEMIEHINDLVLNENRSIRD